MNSNVEKREYWKNHWQDCNNSELTLIAYCEKAGLNRHTFQYWRDKFKIESRSKVEVQKSRFIKVESAARPKAAIASGEIVARLRLSCNLSLECVCWPEPSWLVKIAEQSRA
jgi:hypothetical protein